MTTRTSREGMKEVRKKLTQLLREAPIGGSVKLATLIGVYPTLRHNRLTLFQILAELAEQDIHFTAEEGFVDSYRPSRLANLRRVKAATTNWSATAEVRKTPRRPARAWGVVPLADLPPEPAATAETAAPADHQDVAGVDAIMLELAVALVRAWGTILQQRGLL